MDSSTARSAVTSAAASIVLLVLGPGLAAAAPVTGSVVQSSGSDPAGGTVTPSPFQGVPSWLLILVGIVVIAFAIRVVARRDEGNQGRGGGRDGTDRPRRPFRPD